MSSDVSQKDFAALQDLSSSKKPSINFVSHSNKKEIINIKKKKKKKKIIKKKPIDTTIKAVSIDQGGRYYIELIDPNPEDKDIKPTNDPKHYIPVTGKIDKSFFYLKVPKELVGKPNIKLKIIKRNTHEKKEMPATFIQDLPSIQSGGRLNVLINFKKKSINTKIHIPKYREVSAIPHL